MKEGGYPTWNLRKQRLFTHTNEREMLKSVTFIEASLYFIVCCWDAIDKIILNRLHEHPDQVKILPDSGREEEQ